MPTDDVRADGPSDRGVVAGGAEPAPGEPASSEPASGEPASGEPASGEPPSGEPAPGELAPGEQRPPGPAEGTLGVQLLGEALRASGVAVGTGQLVRCRRAVRVLGGQDLADRYWAARTTMITDPGDLDVFDRVFQVLAARAGEPHRSRGAARGPTHDTPEAHEGPDSHIEVGAPGEDGEDGERGAIVGARASAHERLRHRRFDRASDEERAQIAALIDQLPTVLPRRRARRRRPGAGGTLDVERTLRRALHTDGELITHATRRRVDRPRRVVLLLDVSGSMTVYAGALLRLGIALRRGAARDASQRVEVFAFATRLTRLTEALGAEDPDAAIAAAAGEVRDWDGGTRIGAAVDGLVRTWGRRGVLRGAVVVCCSDGLERGDPDLLAAAMARLQRTAHRVVWVNPLAGGDGFAPTQRGMVAALPHVDVFLPGHDLAAIEDLVAVLRAAR
ncbi:MAG: VWA domain-containing protein [Nitriliruptoraceae bacterium]|nr:VWA domain-containing protein [Nitriliruptoraceae bacterium]